jgi:hypothetical protein
MVHIADVKAATYREWDVIWKSCKTSTYYHSREWAEIWQIYSNDHIQPHPKIISFSDAVKVLLPFSRQEYYRGIIKRYSLAGPAIGSLPFYGNWLTSDTLSDEHIQLLSNYLVNKYKNLVWRLNPFDDNSVKVSINSKYTERKTFVSYMIDLTKGEDKIYANMKPNCRNKIQQAIKNKLIVREADNINDWKSYYEIYKDTRIRWGSKALYILDWKFFELLYNTYNKNKKLWLTWNDNIPIAGSICFYSHRKVLIWHSASLTKYLSMRPVNIARYEIIKDGISKNYCWLDFETAGGHKGLQIFKESFGPEKKMSDRINTWHPIIHYAKKILHK